MTNNESQPKQDLNDHQVSAELYIAADDRVHDGMRKAAGGLIGVSVRTLPDNSLATKKAVRDAAEGLQEFSDDWDLDPANRMRALDLAWEIADGEVVAVEFESSATNNIKNVFMWNAVNYLLNQGEDFDEPSRDITVADADELVDAHISTQMDTRAASMFARDVTEDYRHRANMPDHLASRYDRVDPALERSEATEAAIAVYEEMILVNSARALRDRVASQKD